MQFIVKCCECNRIRMEDRWLPDIHQHAERVSYSHSYCPDCLCKIMAQLEAWDPSQELAEVPAEMPLHQAVGG